MENGNISEVMSYCGNTNYFNEAVNILQKGYEEKYKLYFYVLKDNVRYKIIDCDLPDDKIFEYLISEFYYIKELAEYILYLLKDTEDVTNLLNTNILYISKNNICIFIPSEIIKSKLMKSCFKIIEKKD